VKVAPIPVAWSTGHVLNADAGPWLGFHGHGHGRDAHRSPVAQRPLAHAGRACRIVRTDSRTHQPEHRGRARPVAATTVLRVGGRASSPSAPSSTRSSAWRGSNATTAKARSGHRTGMSSERILEPERDAAHAEATRHRAHEQALSERAPLEDAEAAVLEHLAEIRAAIAHDVAGQTSLQGLRAALRALFRGLSPQHRAGRQRAPTDAPARRSHAAWTRRLDRGAARPA
jgi:hypothetical protein